MPRNSRYIGSALLVLLVCLGLIVWTGFDRLVDDLVRPWAVARAAQALKAEVQLERLELGWGRMALDGLRVDSPGAFRLQVERIDLSGSVSGFFRKRVRTVTIRQPSLEWKEGKAVTGAAVWPSNPPIEIDSWSIEDGSLLLILGKERLLLSQVAARGNLDSSFTVEAAAVVGGRPGVPLAFASQGRWDGRPELKITELLLSGRSILPEPVTVTPGSESFGVTLALEQLNDAEVARLLTALGRTSPWPPELGWEVKAPRLTLRSDREGIYLRLESAGGEVRRKGKRWSWKSLELQIAGRRLEKGWTIQLEQLSAKQIEYLSPEGLSALTGGFLRLAGTLDLRQELAFDLQGVAGGREALAGRWYADLDGLPLNLAVKGIWKPAEGRVRLSRLNFDLAGLVNARLSGSLSGKRVEFKGKLAAPRLDGPFQRRLRQLAGGVAPGLERLELAGAMTAAFSGAWSPEVRKIDATLHLAGVTLAWGDSVRLDGLNCELPLLLHRGASPSVQERPGTLVWDELRAGLVTSAGGSLRLTAGPNRWQMAEPLRLSLAKGWVEVPSLVLTLPEDGIEIRSSLNAGGIDLATVSRALGWPEMGGRVGAEFPDIRYDGEEISTGGETLLQVFNGEVRMRGIRVSNSFSRHRTYHADIDFSGIDLHLLTRAFDFGEINGIADGFVHDLRLFGSVPSAFTAAFETREKGKRNISVKAIRNFNVLSQGGISAALSRSIYRFIDFYRYKKIGIRCSLRNDLFHLEGTAKPGTDNYLIYGGWLPPRLDVVVSTPDISFSEMVSRLKRIERAGR